MTQKTTHYLFRKIGIIAAAGCAAILFCLFFGVVKTDAKTIIINTPEDLKNINWKNKGFGPGNTYIIGNDMTLGNMDDSTCVLTKGTFVIDLNGHTVQNATHNLTVFHVAGATVELRDSKVKKNKPSVRSYGAGAVQITSGKLTIKSGNYLGASDGENNPTALHVGGGTCIVNGGVYEGAYVAASCAGGKLYINDGTFRAGYAFALMRFGAGTIKISKAEFYPGTTTYGFRFPLGSYVGNGSDYNDNFNSWLASGSSYSKDFINGYWNMQSSLLPYPTAANYWAVSYIDNRDYSNANIKVTTTAKPPETRLRSLKAGQGTLKATWVKKTSRTSGYILQYSTSSKFSKVKNIKISGAKKASATIKGLKRKQTYYVRVRTYYNFNGTTLYSKWSKGVKKTTK